MIPLLGSLQAGGSPNQIPADRGVPQPDPRSQGRAPTGSPQKETGFPQTVGLLTLSWTLTRGFLWKEKQKIVYASRRFGMRMKGHVGDSSVR